MKNRAAQIIGVERDDISNGAVMNLVHRFDVFMIGVALRARHHRELLLFGLFGRGQEAPHAHRIGGDGLLGKHMFARIDGGFEMLRPVTGRRGQHHDVNV